MCPRGKEKRPEQRRGAKGGKQEEEARQWLCQGYWKRRRRRQPLHGPQGFASLPFSVTPSRSRPASNACPQNWPTSLETCQHRATWQTSPDIGRMRHRIGRLRAVSRPARAKAGSPWPGSVWEDGSRDRINFVAEAGGKSPAACSRLGTLAIQMPGGGDRGREQNTKCMGNKLNVRIGPGSANFANT